MNSKTEPRTPQAPGAAPAIALAIGLGLVVCGATSAGDAWQYAAMRGDFGELTWLWRDNAAAINRCTTNGWTPLHWAVNQDRLDVAEFLLEHGAKVDGLDSSRWTPIHIAAHRGLTNMVGFLIDRGADVNAPGWRAMTPVHVAAWLGRADTVALLAARGARLDIRDGVFGRQTLHWAAIEGHEKAAATLIALGADVNARDDDGRTAMSLAVLNDYRPVVDLLLRHNVAVDLATAAMLGKVSALTQPGTSGVLLELAAAKGQTESLRVLIDGGAHVDSTGRWNGPALHAAAGAGHVEAVRLLLDKGAAVDGLDAMGWTALMHAAFRGHQKTIDLLLARGADATLKDPAQKDAAAWAEAAGRKDLAKLLAPKSAGAGP